MPGRYKPYPEYKSSSVIGLELIPSDWSLQRVKSLFSIGRGRVISQEELVDDGSYPVYSSQTKNNGCLGCINTYDFDCKQITWTTDGANAGTVFLRSGKHNCTNVCGTLQPKNEDNQIEFILYCLQYVTQFYKRPDTNGAKIMNGEMGEIFIALPPIEVQLTVTSFLDHETAKIDALIEKQQQLIKLLQEKRQAVISHAVTKGLNPDATMKYSGIEWLGQVPAHWDVKRLGHLFAESNRRASTVDELQYPILSVSIHHGISDKELDEDELDRKITRSEDRSLYKVVRDNDLAYNMMRAWQGGFGASKLSGLVSPAYVVCNPRISINSYFFELVLRTPNAVTELKRYSRGITDFRLRLYWDEFKNICVPVPPVREVEHILDSIQKTNSLYENLTAVANRQIELLQERRTALISAAVTGKIDVRGWVSPTETKKDI